MIGKGLDVVRINFSHDTTSDHKNRVAMVRKIAQQCGRDIGIIGDLQGPKIRIKTFDKGKIELNKGDQFFLDSKLAGKIYCTSLSPHTHWPTTHFSLPLGHLPNLNALTYFFSNTFIY